MNQLRKLRRDRNAPVVEFTALTKPDRIPADPRQPVSESTAGANWLTRMLAIIFAILNSVRLPQKKRNPLRNTLRRTNEPTTPVELPVFNFHLPEIFAWLSILTKPGAGPAQPETPHAA